MLKRTHPRPRLNHHTVVILMHQPGHLREILAGRTEPLRTVVVEVVPAQGTGEPQPRVRPPARHRRRLPQTTVHILTIIANPGLNPRIPPRPRTGTTTVPTEHHAGTAERDQPRKRTTTHHHGTHGVTMNAEPYRGLWRHLPGDRNPQVAARAREYCAHQASDQQIYQYGNAMVTKRKLHSPH